LQKFRHQRQRLQPIAPITNICNIWRRLILISIPHSPRRTALSRFKNILSPEIGSPTGRYPLVHGLLLCSFCAFSDVPICLPLAIFGRSFLTRSMLKGSPVSDCKERRWKSVYFVFQWSCSHPGRTTAGGEREDGSPMGPATRVEIDSSCCRRTCIHFWVSRITSGNSPKINAGQWALHCPSLCLCNKPMRPNT
jgi:hypothetical protein